MLKKKCYFAITRVWAKFKTRVAYTGEWITEGNSVRLHSAKIQGQLKLPESALIYESFAS